MTDTLYQIAILWKDSEEETTIICPWDMVIGIVQNLPLTVIERIKILRNEDLL